MQRTGLVIKIGIVLGGLMGAVFAQSLTAPSLGQSETAPTQQVQVTYSAEAAATLPPATLDVGDHASPVPETSTTIGFGGMLALGVGLIAFSRRKNTRDIQNSPRPALEQP